MRNKLLNDPNIIILTFIFTASISKHPVVKMDLPSNPNNDVAPHVTEDDIISFEEEDVFILMREIDFRTNKLTTLVQSMMYQFFEKDSGEIKKRIDIICKDLHQLKDMTDTHLTVRSIS